MLQCSQGVRIIILGVIYLLGNPWKCYKQSINKLRPSGGSVVMYLEIFRTKGSRKMKDWF